MHSSQYSYGECVWDSKRAKLSGETELLESIIPHDRKEAALKLFHENGYKIDGILDKVMQQTPNHGMDWPLETKEEFSRMMSKRHKDFYEVADRINKKAGDCQNYYYTCFKRNQQYLKLKAKRQRVAITSDECVRCKDVGELICCEQEGCNNFYHLHCVQPPLNEVPEGQWFCDDCEVAKLLATMKPQAVDLRIDELESNDKLETSVDAETAAGANEISFL